MSDRLPLAVSRGAPAARSLHSVSGRLMLRVETKWGQVCERTPDQASEEGEWWFQNLGCRSGQDVGSERLTPWAEW